MATTTLTLADDLHAALKELAEADRRSLNSTMVLALEAFVATRTHRSRVRQLAAQVATDHAELLERLG